MKEAEEGEEEGEEEEEDDDESEDGDDATKIPLQSFVVWCPGTCPKRRKYFVLTSQSVRTLRYPAPSIEHGRRRSKS
jgi:hypothetical protein